MSYLKFYKEERKLYHKEFYDIILTKDEVFKIVKKLSRHFKIKQPTTSLKYSMDRGLAKLNTNHINLSKTPSLGLLIHELAHIHNYQKNINWFHNKKLMKTIKRMMKYCMKKNYWRDG